MLARIFGRPSKSSQSAPPAQITRLKSRLGCEMLEARDVPAVLFWNPAFGAGFEASVAENWHVGSATGATSDHAAGASDDLFFTPVAFPISIGGEPPPDDPGSGDPPLMSPGCFFSSASGSLFASIHVVGGYTGTVVLQHDIAVGGFEMTSGSIDQTVSNQSSALTLTVSSAYSSLGQFGGAFTWTGGVLNSGANAGVVSVVGMTNATIGDGTDTSYTTGSDIKLLSGTILSASGSIVLNNDAGVEVTELCQFKGNANPNAGKKWIDLLKGVELTGDIPGLGKVALKGGTINDLNTTDFPILISGGTLNVVSVDLVARKKFTTLPNGLPWAPEYAASIFMMGQSSKINIRDGRVLSAANGVHMEGGLLTTQTEANDINGQPATSHVSYIDGWLEVFGGTISLSENYQGANRATSTLHVTGDVLFLGGSFTPRVYCNNTESVDRITTNGKLFLKNAATITPQVHNKSLAPTANPNGQGLEWTVMWAQMGINSTQGMPTIAPPADWDTPETVFAGGYTGLKLKKLSAT